MFCYFGWISVDKGCIWVNLSTFICICAHFIEDLTN